LFTGADKAIDGAILSTVAELEPMDQATKLLLARSAAKPEATDEILTDPLPAHPVTLIVAAVDGAADWAMATAQPAVAPDKITLLVDVVFTLTLSEKFTIQTKLVVALPKAIAGPVKDAMAGLTVSPLEFETVTEPEFEVARLVLPAISAAKPPAREKR